MPQSNPPPVAIDDIIGLPACPYNGTGYVGIVITSGVPSYFKVIGSNLSRIVKVTWYPANPSSVLFQTRSIILVDDTCATFMIKVINNYLNICDRAGYISFTLDDASNLTFPVKTYGPVSGTPLWTAPDQGLITG